MKQNNTFSAFALPGLTAAIVSGVMTAAGLSLAQDTAPTAEVVKEPVETMQLQRDYQSKPQPMESDMREELFKKQNMERRPEMYDSSDMQKNFEMRMKPMNMDQTMQPDMNMMKGMYPPSMQGVEQNFGYPSSFGQDMNMNQRQDQSHREDQEKKQLTKAIKQAEKMQAKMIKQFDKQIARMEKKYSRMTQKMAARLSKLTDEDDRADMQADMDEAASEYAEMVERLTEEHEDRSEDIADRITDLKEELADLKSEDSDQ